MSLLSRLLNPAAGEVKIPIHQMMAALGELKRRAPGVSQSSIAAAFNMTPGEEAQLGTAISNLQADSITREQIHDVLLLGEGTRQDGSGLPFYSEANVMNRLGL